MTDFNKTIEQFLELNQIHEEPIFSMLTDKETTTEAPTTTAAPCVYSWVEISLMPYMGTWGKVSGPSCCNPPSYQGSYPNETGYGSC